MRRKKRDWGISPIVGQSRWAVLAIELEYGEELNGCDPEVLQVGDLLDHPRIGSPSLRSDP
jgi:hypothetical protein